MNILSKRSGPAFGLSDPYREIANQAMIEIFETIHSHREFIEVLKRVGSGARKGSLQDLMENYYQLFPRRLFQSSEVKRAEIWLSSMY